MKKLVTCVFSLSMIFIFLSIQAKADGTEQSASVISEKASIDFLDISPRTVDAGANVSFAVFFTNKQGASWTKNTYSVYLEIYDEQKKLLTFTDRISGETDIAPQQNGSIIVTYPIPLSWGGAFYAKAKLNLNNEDVAQSDVQFFSVNPKFAVPTQPEVIQKEEEVKVNGNINLSISSSKSDTSSSNYPMNISAIKGDKFFLGVQGNLAFNSGFPDFQNYLIQLKNKSTNAQVGFFYPFYSELSLSGLRTEGVELGYKGKSSSIKVMNGISQRKDIQYGNFERSVKGARVEFESSDKVFNFGLNYLSAHDNSDPTILLSSFNKPIDNDVLSVNFGAAFFNQTMFAFEYSQSKYDKDTTDASTGVSDDAYKMRISQAKQRYSYDINIYNTGLNFYSVGAFPAKDQRGFDFRTNYKLSKAVSFSTSINRYRNNISGNPLLQTLTNLNQSYGFDFAIKGLPNFTLSFTTSDGKSKETPTALVDFVNNGFNFNTYKKVGSSLLNLSIQKSEYDNKVNPLFNSSNFSESLNISSRLTKSTNINLGMNTSKNKYQSSTSDVRSKFYTAGFSYQPLNSRFLFSFNQNWNTTLQLTTTKVLSSNLHFAWDIKPNSWKFIFDQNGSRSSSPTYTSKSTTSNFELQYSLTSKSILSVQYKTLSQTTGTLEDDNVLSLRYLLSF